MPRVHTTSIRRLVSLSTVATVGFLAVLIVAQWMGFQTVRERTREEDTIAVPALVAMLETRFEVVQIQQFLTDISATGDAGGLAEAKEAYENAGKYLGKIIRLAPDIAARIGGIETALDQLTSLAFRWRLLQIREVGESMQSVHRGVDEVMNSVDEISASLREQDTANRDIARNVEGIAQISEETSAIVRNVVLSAEQLERLSVATSESVHRFRT